MKSNFGPLEVVDCLTLTQPWATAIALGVKQYETRSWSTPRRGLIAIHAAKGFPAYAREFAETEVALGRIPKRIPLGAVVAVADLTGVFRTEQVAPAISALERLYGDYGPGRFAWRLENVRPLREPVPMSGRLGVFQIPFKEIEAAIGEPLPVRS